jgi:hypothetical protein
VGAHPPRRRHDWNWPNRRKVMTAPMDDDPDAEVRMLLESNARELFDFR